MANFREWMSHTSTEQQLALATAVATSRQYLYHISAGTRTPSAGMGSAIERVIRSMRRTDKAMPLVTRGDMVPACGGCEYFKACKKSDIGPKLDFERHDQKADPRVKTGLVEKAK